MPSAPLLSTFGLSSAEGMPVLLPPSSLLLLRSLLVPVFMPSLAADFCSVVTSERPLDCLGAPKPTSSSVPGLTAPHALHSVLRAELSVSHLSSGQFQLPGAGRRLFLDDRASFGAGADADVLLMKLAGCPSWLFLLASPPSTVPDDVIAARELIELSGIIDYCCILPLPSRPAGLAFVRRSQMMAGARPAAAAAAGGPVIFARQNLLCFALSRVSRSKKNLTHFWGEKCEKIYADSYRTFNGQF